MTKGEAINCIAKLQAYIAILDAFAHGEKIQVKDAETDQWKDTDSPTYVNATYRIKPQPKYRPFNDTKECFAEMKKHEPFGWVTNPYGAMFNIGSLSNTQGVTFAEDGVSMLYKRCTECGLLFADGTPFGIKVNS